MKQFSISAKLQEELTGEKSQLINSVLTIASLVPNLLKTSRLKEPIGDRLENEMSMTIRVFERFT